MAVARHPAFFFEASTLSYHAKKCKNFGCPIRSLLGTNNYGHAMPAGRPKTTSVKVKVTLPAATYAELERMKEIGRYGSNPAEIARYLLVRAVDEITHPRAQSSSD